jgi:outer membrane immunogenic protein
MKTFFLVLAGGLGLAGSAIAADLPARTYTKAAPIAPLYSWTGCYIGANAGGGTDRESFTHINPDFGVLNFNTNFALGTQHATGAIGGGQIGCDYQIGSWVFGAQGLYDAASLKGSNHVVPGPTDPQFPNIFDLNSRVSSIATATARLGYAIQPQLLIYAKGGAAWMRSDLSYAITGMGITNVYTGVETRNGWTVGAGLEYLITANWSVFAEYSHMDFGSSTLNTRLFTDPTPQLIWTNHRLDTGMVGLNFRLGPSAR